MIAQVLTLWTVLTLAGIGGALSHRAGVLNIALEGFLLLGAFSMTAADAFGLNFPLALAFAAAVCTAAGFAWALWSIRSRGNIFILGLGMNLLAAGGITTLSSVLYGGKGVIQFTRLGAYGHLVLSPWLNLLMVSAAAASAYFLLFRTPAGIAIRAAGSCPGLLSSRHLNPGRYRITALTASAALSGIAGALLALRIGAFVPNMSANRGWIALVLVFIGRAHPFGVAAAALAYSLAEVWTTGLQGSGSAPEQLVLAFPYFITAVFLVAVNLLERFGKNRNNS